MMDVNGAGSARAPGGANGQVAAAFEEQAAALVVVNERVRAAIAVADPAADPEWAGAARRLYDTALAGLLSALEVAVHRIEEALAETRRAIATLSER